MCPPHTFKVGDRFTATRLKECMDVYNKLNASNNLNGTENGLTIVNSPFKATK